MSADQLFSVCNSVALSRLAHSRHRRPPPLGRLLNNRGHPPAVTRRRLRRNSRHPLGRKTRRLRHTLQRRLLFSNRWVLLAGWIHYLCFDLFIGSWQVRDAAANNISHWLVIPCLFLTFMFGPVGLLLYFALRTTPKRLASRRDRHDCETGGAG